MLWALLDVDQTMRRVKLLSLLVVECGNTYRTINIHRLMQRYAYDGAGGGIIRLCKWLFSV